MQFHQIQESFAANLTRVSLTGELRDDLADAIDEGMDRHAFPVFRDRRYDGAKRRELRRVTVPDGCVA